MEYRELGTSGIRISRIGLGAVTFGREIDREKSFDILDLAVERGINLIDTAPVYGGGASETILGEWLRARSPQPSAVVATKVSLDGSEAARLRPFGKEHIRASVEASLKRLGVEAIDLLQLHVFCSATALEITLDALDEQIRQGKVKQIGCSNFDEGQLREAVSLSEKHGLPRIQSSQPLYNLLYREIEQRALPFCTREGISVLSYSPLAAGFLTGKYRPGGAVPKGARFDIIPEHRDIYFSARNFRMVGALEKVAESLKVSLPELAMSWVMVRPGISSVLVGAREPQHLELALRCIEASSMADLVKAACSSTDWPSATDLAE